jgi:hypothetical protein
VTSGNAVQATIGLARRIQCDPDRDQRITIERPYVASILVPRQVRSLTGWFVHNHRAKNGDADMSAIYLCANFGAVLSHFVAKNRPEVPNRSLSSPQSAPWSSLPSWNYLRNASGLLGWPDAFRRKLCPKSLLRCHCTGRWRKIAKHIHALSPSNRNEGNQLRDQVNALFFASRFEGALPQLHKWPYPCETSTRRSRVVNRTKGPVRSSSVR